MMLSTVATILLIISGYKCQRTGPQFNFPGNPASSSSSSSSSSSPSSQPNFQNFQPPVAISGHRESNSGSVNIPAAPRPIPATNFICPEKTGFFPHAKSCDKYYACENGTATLKTCGNGLVFDDSDYMRENCAYPFSVDCGHRTDMEPPISTPNCPRLYGIFPHATNCRVFYSCWNGEANRYDCPPGLAYDDEQRVCVWADLVNRCDQATLSDGFVCAEGGESDQPGHYTRHAHPTDCRKFYVCIDGVARPYGCSFGTVFNTDTLQCDEPENVQGCEKYYGDVDPKTAKKLKGQN